MAFKYSKQKIKNAFKYTQKIISYACIVILVLLAVFFVSNFIESKISAKKGKTYIPRFSLYTIISPSMIPNINVYDVIFDVKVKDPSKIKKGDVITFVSRSAISNGLVVTHRVTRVVKNDTGYEYFTKGDANLFEDSATAASESLIGKVIFKIPQLGRLQFLIKTKVGWLLCIVLPALLIIIFDILKLNKTMKLQEAAEAIKNGGSNADLPVVKIPDNLPQKIIVDETDNELPQKIIVPSLSEDDLPKKNTITTIDESDDLPKLK